MSGVGSDALHGEFGLSYASFLILPRVCMRLMPDAWQAEMARLMSDFDDAFPDREGLAPALYATARRDGKMVKMPDWLLNYRYPDTDVIDRMRGEPLKDDPELEQEIHDILGEKDYLMNYPHWFPMACAPKDIEIIGWSAEWTCEQLIQWCEYEPDVAKEFGVEGYWAYVEPLLHDAEGEAVPTRWRYRVAPPRV